MLFIHNFTSLTLLSFFFHFFCTFFYFYFLIEIKTPPPAPVFIIIDLQAEHKRSWTFQSKAHKKISIKRVHFTITITAFLTPKNTHAALSFKCMQLLFFHYYDSFLCILIQFLRYFFFPSFAYFSDFIKYCISMYIHRTRNNNCVTLLSLLLFFCEKKNNKRDYPHIQKEKKISTSLPVCVFDGNKETSCMHHTAPSSSNLRFGNACNPHFLFRFMFFSCVCGCKKRPKLRKQVAMVT